MINYYHLTVLKEHNLLTPRMRDILANVQPQDSETAYYIAGLVGKATSEQEAVIAQDGYLSYRYALNVLHGPFPLGEPAIRDDWDCWEAYQNLLAAWKAEQTLKS